MDLPDFNTVNTIAGLLASLTTVWQFFSGYKKKIPMLLALNTSSANNLSYRPTSYAAPVATPDSSLRLP